MRDGPATVFDLVDRYGMQCQASRSATVHMAHSPAGLTYLRDRCRQLQEIGAGVEMLDGAATQALSASPAYRHGGILDPGAGTIQPLSYARELARCAIERGARLYQQSALQSLRRDGEGWLASAASGQVRAGQVILATNAYADSASQGVRESIVPVYIFHFATAPLPGTLAEELIPARQGLWDTHTLLTSSRIDEDGRLVMSFPGRLHGGQRATREAFATRRRNFLYPQTRHVPWEYCWTGRVGVTSGNLLRVQEPAPGLFAPAGYNGRGIGTGSVIGRELARLVAGGARDDFPFPLQPLYRERWRGPRGAYYDYGTLALQLLSQRF